MKIEGLVTAKLRPLNSVFGGRQPGELPKEWSGLGW